MYLFGKQTGTQSFTLRAQARHHLIQLPDIHCRLSLAASPVSRDYPFRLQCQFMQAGQPLHDAFDHFYPRYRAILKLAH